MGLCEIPVYICQDLDVGLKKSPLTLDDDTVQDDSQTNGIFHYADGDRTKTYNMPRTVRSAKLYLKARDGAKIIIPYAARLAKSTLLHEFSHAYHHYMGWDDNKEIIKLYKAAVRRCSRVEKSQYRFKNAREYFAVNSEAYHNVLDESFHGSPSNKDELAELDSACYNLLEDMFSWDRDRIDLEHYAYEQRINGKKPASCCVM